MHDARKRDAFAVLRSSAKRFKPSSALSDSGQLSSFQACPICEAAVPRRLIQEHAAVCNGTAVKPQTVKADTQDTSAVTPVLSSSQHTPKTEQPSLQKDANENAHACTQPTASKTNNAFSFLMAEQRERSQVFVFFLEQKPDQTWQAYWFAKGTKTTKGIPNSTSASGSEQSADSDVADISLPASQAVWTATTQMSNSTLQAINAPAATAAKPKVTVQLQTNVAAGAQSNLDQLASPQGSANFKGSPSLLKSALQKNVRLCRAAPAVRCALQLMRDNAAEFLRRVSIICLEDAILHPAMPLLVWLMCAQAKGDPATLDKGSDKSLGQDEDLLVRCISIRAAYGGMGGDVAMLKAFASVWASRFCTHLDGDLVDAVPKPVTAGIEFDNTDTHAGVELSWLTYIQQAYAKLNLPPGGVSAIAMIPLARGDIPLSAVDFHISSIVEELMQNSTISAAAQTIAAPAGQNASDLLRRAMWLFRSGLNSKEKLFIHSKAGSAQEKQTLEPLWQAAHAAADSWSADYIRRRFG